MLTLKDRFKKRTESLRIGLNIVVVLTAMVWPSLSETASTAELKKQCNVDLVTATKVNTWTNNNVVFITDEERWGVVDYWQTPRETLHHLTGDCEDYAIFKYHTLISWGVPAQDLQLWYGYENTAHMVVIYCGLVLDSLTDQILPISTSTFQPIIRIDNSTAKIWINLKQRTK